MRQFVLIIGFGLIATAVNAQKSVNCSFAAFTKEYVKLMGIQPAQNYVVGISSSYYENQADPKPVKKSSSDLKVFENSQYVYSNGAAIQIQEGSVRLDVDTIKKRLLISKANVLEDFLNQIPSLEDADSTNYKVSKIITKQKITYVLTEQKRTGQYHTIKMSFDVVTNHFLELELVFWPDNYTSADLLDESMESPRILMTYSSFKTGVNSTVLTDGEHLSDWCTTDGSGHFSSNKTNYTLYDLRK